LRRRAGPTKIQYCAQIIKHSFENMAYDLVRVVRVVRLWAYFLERRKSLQINAWSNWSNWSNYFLNW